MEAAKSILMVEMDRIFRASVGIPPWLSSLSQSFAKHSLPSHQAWAEGRFAIFLFGARRMTDVACCNVMASADAAIDAQPLENRVAELAADAKDVHRALQRRGGGLIVSQTKEDILSLLCASELSTMRADSWTMAARSRIESFFWAFMFSLNDPSLAYGLRSPAWMSFVVGMCCAFTIIDDAMDEAQDRESRSNTLFSMLPRAEAVPIALSLIGAVCEHARSYDTTYIPFFALNTAVLQALTIEDRQLLDAHGVKNYATAAALAVALNEAHGTDKHVFDVSKFMYVLGQPVDNFCMIV
jgi:hypothetical protein